MKREKLVISLIIMVVLLFVFTVNTLATGDSSITVRSGNSTTVTPSTNGNSTTLTPSNNVGASGNQTIRPANSASTNNSSSEAAGSSYRNLAASTNIDNTASGLPYTGSSYGIFFVIVALVVSAVYAYKKVSDYNM